MEVLINEAYYRMIQSQNLKTKVIIKLTWTIQISNFYITIAFLPLCMYGNGKMEIWKKGQPLSFLRITGTVKVVFEWGQMEQSWLTSLDFGVSPDGVALMTGSQVITSPDSCGGAWDISLDTGMPWGQKGYRWTHLVSSSNLFWWHMVK